MSRESVDVVQAIYDDVLARGRMRDPATFGRVQELFDPDVEFVQMEDVLGAAGHFRGYGGLLETTRELLAVFDDFHIVPERHFEAGDLVVSIVRSRGVGRGSDVKVDARIGHLWELRAGRVRRWVVYATPEEALQAAGLPAQSK